MPTVDPLQHLVRLGRGAADDPDLTDELRRVTEAFRAADRRRVVLHFLDEFLPAADATAAVGRWLPAYEKSTADLYPIFFGWDGSLGERIRADVAAWAKQTFLGRLIETAYRIVRQGVRFVLDKPGDRAAAPVLDPARDGVSDADLRDLETLAPGRHETVFGKPGSDEFWAALEARLLADDFIQNVRHTDRELYDGAVAIEEWAAGPGGPCPVPLPPELVGRLTDGLPTNTRSLTLGGFVLHHVFVTAVVAARRVYARFRAGRDHGFRATVVEEVLRELYASEFGVGQRLDMRDGIQDVFADGPGAKLTAAMAAGGGSVVGVVAQGLGIEGAGGYFRHMSRNPTPPSKIRMVAIAPTVSFRRMSEILDFGGTNVADVLTLGLDDPHERGDRLHDTFYPLSVLYFASGLYETEADFPYAGMQRFHVLPSVVAGDEVGLRAAVKSAWQWSPANPPAAVVRHRDWAGDAATDAYILNFLG